MSKMYTCCLAKRARVMTTAVVSHVICADGDQNVSEGFNGDDFLCGICRSIS